MKDKEKRLAKIISKMDVPSYRTGNYPWLLDNLGERNSQDSNYEEAISILLEILREKNLISKKDWKRISLQLKEEGNTKS